MKKLFLFTIFYCIFSFISAQQYKVFKTKNELRTYLISKMIWNPDTTIDSKKRDFLEKYFERAAPYIKNIIDTIVYTLEKPSKPVLLYNHPSAHRDDYLSPSMMKYYHLLIAIAMIETLDNPKLLKRVDKFAQTFRYADIEVAKAMINTDYWVFEKAKDSTLVLKTYYDSLLTEFSGKNKIFGQPVLYETSLPPDQYESKTRNYFNTAIEKHLAVGAKISFKELYDKKYKANGPQSLTDGIHGFENWEVLWQGWHGKDLVATIDLGSSKQIHQVKMNFMDDNRNSILAPVSLKVEMSTDGKNFNNAGTVLNPHAGIRLEKQIVPMEINLTSPVQTKFLRVTVKNIGKLPAWRGLNGDAWIFTDEIVVK